jgi:hypothetical protein
MLPERICFDYYIMRFASHERRKMNVNGMIQGCVDMIGALIAFVFIAIIACAFDPITDALSVILS